ncbi:hypothetical protein MK280_04035 [Myxococcota bacterium]|nr:hypothetical protein [Myxococcota bacterium]
MEKQNRECYQEAVEHFTVNSMAGQAQSEIARQLGQEGNGEAHLQKLASCSPEQDILAASLLLDPSVSTQKIAAAALVARDTDPTSLETFAPLYISNECDAECKMCGMRGPNAKLIRETASRGQVREQLEILRSRRMPGVAILAGEYRYGGQRKKMLGDAAEAMKWALEIGFSHILINIGSLERAEYERFFMGVDRDKQGALKPHLTMCTFQETYDTSVYARFMGSNPGNPRADFQRRIANFERAYEAGLRSANPGVLLGLNPDLTAEFLTLCAHVRHLDALGFSVYVSLPRLRKASGTVHHRGVSDEQLVRFVALVSLQCPESKIVISTRERPEIQRMLLPLIQVLTPGSPGVAPYTAEGARFEVEASQFEVLDQRPFETILNEHVREGAVIEGYDPGPE